MRRYLEPFFLLFSRAIKNKRAIKVSRPTIDLHLTANIQPFLLLSFFVLFSSFFFLGGGGLGSSIPVSSFEAFWTLSTTSLIVGEPVYYAITVYGHACTTHRSTLLPAQSLKVEGEGPVKCVDQVSRFSRYFAELGKECYVLVVQRLYLAKMELPNACKSDPSSLHRLPH